MKRDKFALAFLGIFLLVLVIFSTIFVAFSGQELNDGSQTVLWGALIFLILLFGIIGISLFLNRDKH